MAELVGISEKVKDKRFSLERDRTTIGRTGDNTITLDDPTVSANHCYIAKRGGRHVLHDLNSTNGTLVNDKLITECELESGQTISIGGVQLAFISGAGEPGGSETKVEKTQLIGDEPSSKPPKSFTSISPFGAKRRKSKGLSGLLLAAVGLLAIAGVGLLIYYLFFEV